MPSKAAERTGAAALEDIVTPRLGMKWSGKDMRAIDRMAKDRQHRTGWDCFGLGT